MTPAEILSALLALLTIAFPLPNFADRAATVAWGAREALLGPIYDLAAGIAAQLKSAGVAEIMLPDGTTVPVHCCADGTVAMADHHCCALAAALDAEAASLPAGAQAIDWSAFINTVLLPLVAKILAGLV